MTINKLRECIYANRYEISLHAQKERSEEGISIQDIEYVLLTGEIIENYPKDVRGHSCLTLGYSINRPIHIVCSILPSGWLRIITVYIPKLPKWRNPKKRRR